MFNLVSKDRDETMLQTIYTYENNEKVILKIYVDDKKQDFLESRIACVIIEDPKSIEYGMSLSFRLEQFFLGIERPVDIPISDINYFLNNINRLKELSSDINELLNQFK